MDFIQAIDFDFIFNMNSIILACGFCVYGGFRGFPHSAGSL